MFETTVWSRIAAAQRQDALAVEEFVARYRPPLLQYVAYWGFSAEETEDLLQEILLRLFAKDALNRADQTRGRFRSFLLSIAGNVIRDELDRRNASKRGGGERPLPLSEVGEPASMPPKEFDQLWLQHLLKLALNRLEEKHSLQHQVLQLRFQEGLSNSDIAARTDRTTEQIHSDLYRARKRLVKILRDEVGRYASSSEEYSEELALFQGLLAATKPN